MTPGDRLCLSRTRRSPKILWVELTSRCPYDCVFCSRKMVRGQGEHMDFELYRSLIAQLDRPEIIRLNYSGESIHYPRLIDAIKLAKTTGAATELVTALSSARDETVRGIVEAGLDRLTVSIHTMEDAAYQSIYRFGSLAALKTRLESVLRMRGGANRPRLDFAFVAMERNLEQLGAVAEYARSLGVPLVSVLPLIRRDPVPEQVREGFGERLRLAVAEVQRRCPEVAIEALPDCAAPLSPGARIRTCEQNPWETAHVLSNGDVVVCETLDRRPLGNLRESSLADIWHGSRYRDFRRQYSAARIPECMVCPWKDAAVPQPLTAYVRAGDGYEHLMGWHAPDGSGVLWSKPDSRVLLKNAGAKLQLEGMLPQALDGRANALVLMCNGRLIGEVANATRALLHFRCSFELPAAR